MNNINKNLKEFLNLNIVKELFHALYPTDPDREPLCEEMFIYKRFLFTLETYNRKDIRQNRWITKFPEAILYGQSLIHRGGTSLYENVIRGEGCAGAINEGFGFQLNGWTTNEVLPSSRLIIEYSQPINPKLGNDWQLLLNKEKTLHYPGFTFNLLDKNDVNTIHYEWDFRNSMTNCVVFKFEIQKTGILHIESDIGKMMMMIGETFYTSNPELQELISIYKYENYWILKLYKSPHMFFKWLRFHILNAKITRVQVIAYYVQVFGIDTLKNLWILNDDLKKLISSTVFYKPDKQSERQAASICSAEVIKVIQKIRGYESITKYLEHMNLQYYPSELRAPWNKILEGYEKNLEYRKKWKE